MHAKKGGYAVQRLYRREGRHPTKVATLVRLGKQKRRKEDAQRQLAALLPRSRRGFTVIFPLASVLWGTGSGHTGVGFGEPLQRCALASRWLG
jgi:hypothetical protein